MKPRGFDEIEIGETYSVTRKFTKRDLENYKRLMNDNNPLHKEFIPELLMVSVAASIDWVKGVSSIVLSYEAEFYLCPKIGERITFESKVSEKDPLRRIVCISLKAFNEKGEIIGMGKSTEKLGIDLVTAK